VGVLVNDCRGYGGDLCPATASDREFPYLARRLRLPLIAVAGFAAVKFELHRKNERNAFLASCTYFLGMLTSVVFGVYPMVLPARNPAFSLTVQNAKAADYGLKIA